MGHHFLSWISEATEACCNIGGVPEGIGKHGETGMLAEPDDVESLMVCLDVLIGDSEKRVRIGLAGRKRY